jgi:RNA polymerase sigma-70 factor (ECF subfamily)
VPRRVGEQVVTKHDGGDHAVRRFTELCSETYRPVLAYAMRRTRSVDDAHDVVSSTFLVAWRRLDDVLDADVPLAWLYGVARKTLSNQRRSTQRQAAVAQRAAEFGRDAHQVGADRIIESQAEWSKIMTALETLSERDREVLRLAAFEQLAPAEIAVVLGVSSARARTWLYRARRRLNHAAEAPDVESGGGR